MIRSNYYNSKRGKFSKAIGFFVLAFLSLCLVGVLLSQPVANIFSVVLRPLWWSSEGLSHGIQSVSDYFKNQNSLAVNNRRLQEENNKLKSIVLSKSQVESDNIYFRKLLGRITIKEKPIVGAVIFLPNFVPYQTLLIDIGQNNSNRKLKIGDLAVSNNNVVGRLVEVGKWYSKVQLLSAEKKISVAIGEKNVPGLAEGMGVGNYGIVLPKNTEVKIGDRVMAPLLNNLLIGTVRYIQKNPSQPNQVVLVKTTINLWQLKWLEFYDLQN